MLIVDTNLFPIRRVFLINYTLTPNAECQETATGETVRKCETKCTPQTFTLKNTQLQRTSEHFMVPVGTARYGYDEQSVTNVLFFTNLFPYCTRAARYACYVVSSDRPWLRIAFT